MGNLFTRKYWEVQLTLLLEKNASTNKIIFRNSKITHFETVFVSEE